MVVVGWTGCQDNAKEICGLHTKTNTIIHKQWQQSMDGVKPHFLLEVLNALDRRIRYDAFPSQGNL